jgi:hypothetical protein
MCFRIRRTDRLLRGRLHWQGTVPNSDDRQQPWPANVAYRPSFVSLLPSLPFILLQVHSPACNLQSSLKGVSALLSAVTGHYA